MPARRERAGLGLAVTDHTRNEQLGIVERGAVRVHERVAELATLVDRARGLGSGVAGDAPRERELVEERAHARLVARDVRIHLGVAAFEVRARDDGRPAVPRTTDEQRVATVAADHPVDVRVHEVESRRGPPVTEQTGLRVLEPQGLAQAAGCRAGRSARRRDSSRPATTRRSGRARRREAGAASALTVVMSPA